MRRLRSRKLLGKRKYLRKNQRSLLKRRWFLMLRNQWKKKKSSRCLLIMKSLLVKDGQMKNLLWVRKFKTRKRLIEKMEQILRL